MTPKLQLTYKITPVILAGGSGKRLWPLSREKYPKQYLSIVSKNTLLQDTILRLRGIKNVNSPIVVCNIEHRSFVNQQCQDIGYDQPRIIIEEEGRNTLPAITLATLESLNEEDSIILVLSSDHLLKNNEAFSNSIHSASDIAAEGSIILLGVEPSYPHTGYGYIKVSESHNKNFLKFEKFIEKPTLRDAKSYISQGKFLWNSGIFVFKASEIIKEIREHEPETLELASYSLKNAIRKDNFIFPDNSFFKKIRSNSIDYAIFENTKNIKVVELNSEWSDLGTWDSIFETSDKDKNGNYIIGDAHCINTQNSYINATNHMLVSIGVEDLIIVDTADATLVASKNQSDEIVKFLSKIKSSGRKENSTHLKVYRPWGFFEILENGKNFQVKKLHIKPHSKLSLQSHNKRSEHWVVVDGQATVTRDKCNHTLNSGGSIEIPIGTIHRLENLTNDPVEMIEVQIGQYLDEDDITRYADIYGRD